MSHCVRRFCPPLCVAIVALAALPALAGDVPPPGARVDIQAALCASPELLKPALNLQPSGPPLNVWLFDDAALHLFEKGLRIRLREGKKGAELTLKAANQDCAHLAPGVMRKGQGKCEYDDHGGHIAGALSLSRKVDATLTADLAAGRKPLASALSKAQIRLLQSVPGAWPQPEGMRALGPTQVSSYQSVRYAVDFSELPGGERFIEISRKGKVQQAESIRQHMNDDLAAAGMPLCADQSAQAVNKLRPLLKAP